MLTIHKILNMYGIDPNETRLVRHGNKEIPILDTYKNNLPRFEAYQSFQIPRKFADAKRVVVFAPYYKTTAILLGVWDIHGCQLNNEFTEETRQFLANHDLPPIWFEDSVKYDLRRNSLLDDISERLVIEWGKATVAWVQSKDKEVVEVKGKMSVGDFQSFSKVNLSFSQLKNVIEYPDTNLTWVKVLSSVNGVYLIKDRATGKLYVGSAYGKGGVFGRWANYAQSGHGNNQGLMGLDPRGFQFSILEVVSATTTADEVIEIENRWKEKLGSRQFGLNNN